MAAGRLTTETVVNTSFTPVDQENYSLVSCVHALVTLYIFNLVLILPFHCYVMWLIVTGMNNGLTSDFSSLNLSVCEILICLSSVSSIFSLLDYETCVKYFLYNAVLFLYILLEIGRPLLQCYVCLERYVAVVHPVIYLKYKPLRYRAIYCAIVWVVVFGSWFATSMSPLGLNLFYYMLSPYYLILFVIVVICSVAVFRVLKQPRPGWNVRDKESNHMKKTAFWMIIVFLVSMVINFVPAVIFNCVYELLPYTEQWTGSVSIYCYRALTGFVHPVMYLYRTRKLPFINCL